MIDVGLGRDGRWKTLEELKGFKNAALAMNEYQQYV